MAVLFRFCHNKKCKRRPKSGNYCCKCRKKMGPDRFFHQEQERAVQARNHSIRLGRAGNYSSICSPLRPELVDDTWLEWAHYDHIAKVLGGPNGNIPSFLGEYMNNYRKIAKSAAKWHAA